MSDCSQDSQKTIPSAVEDLTSVMNATTAGGRSFAEFMNVRDARKPTYVPAKSKCAPKKLVSALSARPSRPKKWTSY